MTGSDTLPVQLPSDGIQGLAMMAPVVGLPLLLHAVGGAVITGAGFAAVSTVVSPIAAKIFQATNMSASGHRRRIAKAVPELPVSVPITVTVVEELPSGNEDRIPIAAEANI
ncbi:hypothetical protein [Chlorobium sp.]|uniref:hypothetical protein n=1 Tax=Chlorobium sp. TaxID=1095 RepID=UPI002F40B381